MTFLATDPFTRTTSNGLGTEPVSGQTYGLNTTNTAYSTTGSVARIATSSVNQLYYATIDTSKTDHTAKVTITVPVLPTGAAITLRVVARWKDASNFYEAQLSIAITTGAATLAIQKRTTAGGLATVVSGVSVGTHVAGNAWTIILQPVGTRVRARAWNASTGSDPGTWQCSAVDTSLADGTFAGFGCRRETSNSNGTQNIDFDNFSVETLITLIAQDVWPTRVLVSVTGILPGDPVAIYRVVGGERTLIQGGQTDAATDVAFLRVDAQLPFGIPVAYLAEINGGETTTSTTTYTLVGGNVAVTDAITGLGAEVLIGAWPEKVYDPQATVFRAGGRNIVVSGGGLGQFESDVEIPTLTTAAAEQLRLVFDQATQGIVQVRQPGGYDDVDCYVAITAYRSRRWSQEGQDQKRLHIVHLVEADGWAAALQASGFTYQDVADTYAGLTYADLAADFPTYLALAQGDFS